MADLSNRLPQNAPGRFYVDSDCISCGLCNELAPTFFKIDHDSNYSFVYHQPAKVEDIQLCQEALEKCPVEAIGDTEAA